MRITVFGAAFLLAGAEPEAMITAAIASGRHHYGLAAGDAVGRKPDHADPGARACCPARPLPFGGRVRMYAAWSALAGALAALLVAGGHIGRAQGGHLLAAYLAGLALLWRREREPPAAGEAAEAGQATAGAGSRNPLLDLGLALGGIALMAAGSGRMRPGRRWRSAAPSGWSWPCG